MRLALFEPDIPQNTGAMLRLAACLEVDVDLIEPCGFVLSDRRLRRAGMDYLDRVRLVRHASWAAFREKRRTAGGRLVLLSRHARTPHIEFAFRPDDTLLVGRESAGVPDHVRETIAADVRVPMAKEVRSLNVALAAALVLGEALRQTGGFPSGVPAGAAA
jgi:tRNA (cytidine/uridine-2'-O-)-methyltransferase